jgi:hypothetical protein
VEFYPPGGGIANVSFSGFAGICDRLQNGAHRPRKVAPAVELGGSDGIFGHE